MLLAVRSCKDSTPLTIVVEKSSNFLKMNQARKLKSVEEVPK